MLRELLWWPVRVWTRLHWWCVRRWARHVGLYDDMRKAAPGRCPECALHRYGINFGWIPRTHPVIKHQCPRVSRERLAELHQAQREESFSYAELLEIDEYAVSAGIVVTDEMLAGDVLDLLEQDLLD